MDDPQHAPLSLTVSLTSSGTELFHTSILLPMSQLSNLQKGQSQHLTLTSDTGLISAQKAIEIVSRVLSPRGCESIENYVFDGMDWGDGNQSVPMLVLAVAKKILLEEFAKEVPGDDQYDQTESDR